jgi:hypothetical protein
VPNPVGTKIKLNLSEPTPTSTPSAAPTKVILKIGAKSSPATTPAPHTNGTGNHAAGQNGTSRKNPFGGSQSSSTPVPSLEQIDRAKSASAAGASPSPSVAAPVKREEIARDSPALLAGNEIRSTSQASSTPAVGASGMAPPLTPNPSLPTGLPLNHQQQQQPSYPLAETHLRQPDQGMPFSFKYIILANCL